MSVKAVRMGLLNLLLDILLMTDIALDVYHFVWPSLSGSAEGVPSNLLYWHFAIIYSIQILLMLFTVDYTWVRRKAVTPKVAANQMAVVSPTAHSPPTSSPPPAAGEAVNGNTCRGQMDGNRRRSDWDSEHHGDSAQLSAAKALSEAVHGRPFSKEKTLSVKVESVPVPTLCRDDECLDAMR